MLHSRRWVNSFIIILVLIMSCGGNSSSQDNNDGKGEGNGNPTFFVSPNEKKLLINQTYQLQAIQSLSSGLTETVTESAMWESSNESVATVSNLPGTRGHINSISIGTTTITVRYNEMSSSALIMIVEGGSTPLGTDTKIIFLHHSTGYCIWAGGVSAWFTNYNTKNAKSYTIQRQDFPKSTPYGWNNYPYDYWNVWVNHAGNTPYLDEPTLEMLTNDYNVIVLKHCFPVSLILPDTGAASIQSSEKRIENYKLQYNALKNEMREFPERRFILWTGAANVQGATTAEQATRARAFFDWVKSQWDEPGDNIFVWDFFELETEGGIYLKESYAASAKDSHPNTTLSRMVAPLFCTRVVDVIEGRGDLNSLTGK